MKDDKGPAADEFGLQTNGINNGYERETSPDTSPVLLEEPTEVTESETIRRVVFSSPSNWASQEEILNDPQEIDEGGHVPPGTLEMEEVPEREKLVVESSSNCLCDRVMQGWANTMDKLRSHITRGILAVTQHAATHPYAYVIGVAMLSTGLMAVGMATNFDMSANAQQSYTPKDSEINEQRHWIDDISGLPPPPLSIRAVIHAEGETVLTKEAVEHAFQVVDKVYDTPGYQDLCSDAIHQLASKEHYETTGYVGGYYSECRIRGVSMLWNNSRDIMEEEVQSDKDIVLAVAAKKYPDGSDVDSREIMGRKSMNQTTIVSAESWLMEVTIPAKQEEASALQHNMLNQLLDLRNDLSNSKYKLEVFTSESLELETTRAVLVDLPLIAVVFVVMALFTCAVFSSNNNRGGASSSHVLLGLGAVVCVVFSLASSYGLLWIIGVPFSNLTQILPFVMFGIGLDDSFIIFGEFCRTDPKKAAVQRIHETFEEVGLSIVVTKMTTGVAFALGCLSNIPTLTWLSTYAFPTVLIDAVYQISFFVALIVLDERRIAANRRDCLVCLRRQTNVAEHDVAEDESSGDSSSSYQEGKKTGEEPEDNNSSSFICYPSQGDGKSRVDSIMGWYSDLLALPFVKILVGIIFTGMIVGLTYSASFFRQEFDVREMLPGQSYARDYLQAMENHGERGWLIPTAYFRDVNQADPIIQEEMEKYINDLASMDSMNEQPPFFWLRHFKEFLTYDERLLELTFNQQLGIFLSIGHFKTLYGDHIIRDPESGDILASRCLLYMDNVDLNSVSNQTATRWELVDVNAAQHVNQQAERDGYPKRFFLAEPSMLYVWEFYEDTVGELIFTTVLGVLSVGVIGFVFIPHWTASLYLFPILSFLYVELIGFLQLFVQLNAVSFFALIMSIGLLVDFNVHILLRYYESPCLSREAKVKDALTTMGSSVMMGGFSTFLGVLPLVFSSSEVMRTLFFGFIGMVLLGCSHGLILLPVILSVTGPIETPGTRDARLSRVSQPLTSFDSKDSTPTRFMGSSFISNESSEDDENQPVTPNVTPNNPQPAKPSADFDDEISV